MTFLRRLVVRFCCFLLCCCCTSAAAATAAAAPTLEQCGGVNGTTFCPFADDTSPASSSNYNDSEQYQQQQQRCCHASYSPSGYGCLREDSSSSNNKVSSSKTTPTTNNHNMTCCMPGPPLPPSQDRPNYLVIGDSVSIGYFPFAERYLWNDGTCQLQHGPWDLSDGGAASTGRATVCLENYLVTQHQTDVRWDAILFNFGLHNLDDNSTKAKALYKRQLAHITQRLAETGAKLLYALTTPFMPDAKDGNFIVDELNHIALQVMKDHHHNGQHGNVVSIVDLNGLVHDHCGRPLYETCDWCSANPCSFHYSETGRMAQGQFVAEAFQKVTATTTTTTTTTTTRAVTATVTKSIK